jgi:hypothetical protein
VIDGENSGAGRRLHATPAIGVNGAVASTTVARFVAALKVLLLAALPMAAEAIEDTTPPALGLCPATAGRLDGYQQALCQGEASLQANDTARALEHFRQAAALPRLDATHELAWAGLAAAHCRADESDAGRQWQGHFNEARKLWLGELDCEAAAADPRAALSPFVRSRMCGGTLAADYKLVRSDPQAPHAKQLLARLQQLADAIARVCAAAVAASPAAPLPQTATAPPATAKAKKRSASGKPAAGQPGNRRAAGSRSSRPPPAKPPA